MVQVGRVACIATPFILSIIALCCLVLVFLAGVTEKDNITGGLYLYKIDTTNLKVHPENDTTLTVTPAQKNQTGITDYYTIYLRNYCAWSGKAAKYSNCTEPKAYFWFNPYTVWSQPDTHNTTDPSSSYDPKQDITNSVSDLFTDPSSLASSIATDPDALLTSLANTAFTTALKSYRKGSRDLLNFVYIALACTAGTLVVGCTAIFSRWGSFLTTFCAVAACVACCGVTAIEWGLANLMEKSMNLELEKRNGIKTQAGKEVLWINVCACLAAGGAAFFWFLSVFCCSGRSPYGKKDRSQGRGWGFGTGKTAGWMGPAAVEKAPYTYERVGGQRGLDVGDGDGVEVGRPVAADHNVVQGPGESAYEPFRHQRAEA